MTLNDLPPPDSCVCFAGGEVKFHSARTIVNLVNAAVAAEREACAISCEVNAARWIDAGGKQWYAAHECAAAIRARGQA